MVRTHLAILLLCVHFIFTIIGDDFQVGNEGTTDDSMYRQQPRYFEKLGTCTAFFLENFFTRWGTFFASHPWLTLFGGAVAVAILGSGIALVEITTDPVQLWASPTSKSRMEREFFDSTFEPFFRIEQVCCLVNIKVLNFDLISI